MKAVFAACWIALLGRTAHAEDEAGPIREPGATWRQIFQGPFEPSQLFTMPTANVVGAYQLRLYGDASLLAEDHVLSTSSVAAIGFGDLAQLEYRQSAAISRSSPDLFGLPSIGVQFEVPLRERKWVPRFGLALRFGLAREDEMPGEAGGAARTFEERGTDLYLVTSLALAKLHVHLGTRITSASIEETRVNEGTEVQRTLVLPAFGLSYEVSRHSSLLFEGSMIPRFDLPSDGGAGAIGSDPYGRAGVRWNALPWLTVDASVGYHLELERRGEPESGALVDWDIRLGGELAIPWGAIVCRGVGIFCS